MKQFYQTPSLTVQYLPCNDIVTASIVDDAEGFNLGWIGE